MAAKQVPEPSRTTKENVLSTLYQEKMVTEQEVEELKQAARPWVHLVEIQCTKSPHVMKRTAELLAEVGRGEEGKQLKVLAALYQKKVITQHDLQKWKRSARNMLFDPIFDLCTRPSEDVATAADVLDMVGWKEKAEMLRVLSVLYQKKVLAHHEVVEIHHEVVEIHPEMLEYGHETDEVLSQVLINVQCRKPPEVMTITAEVLDELGLKEEATQLRVMAELYQKGLLSEDDLSFLPQYMMGYMYRHWLDFLVNVQYTKSDDVHARTFEILRRYSQTKSGKERQTKPTGFETSEKLPSPSTKWDIEAWGRLSKESQLESSLKERSVSSPKTKVSSLQAGGGSDPPEREGTSNLLSDEAALKRLCWIPFGIKTVSIEAKGGILCLEPQSDDIQMTKEDTIFVEVPLDAVSTSADVKMRYAIIPSGPFTLPKGYQFGSPVVYIYYDGRHVTKPLALHLPHWHGGEDRASDGLSFYVAPHSLKGRSVYNFQLLAGGKFPGSSRYGVVEINGHCSLYAEVFELGTRVDYHIFCLNKEEEEETEYKRECNIAVTYASYCWRTILQENRPGWEISKPAPFQFKSEKITATLEKHHHENDDWRANFCGALELLPHDVQYSSCGIYSDEQLEMAVKNSSYPPTIECFVKYRKELKRTGRPTEVKLHISGMDREMEFSCPAYEQKQGGHEDVKDVERSPPSSWHANANVVGANVGRETDEHEYKSLVIPADKTKKPKPMGPCKDTSEVRADKTKKPPPMGPCRDTREVLNEVVDHSKEINAMLNHHTGGTVHFGINDDGIVEEGLDLPQDALIDKLQTRVGQLLERFHPPVQSRFVAIQPVNLVNSSGEPTGRWCFDICVTPYHSEVVLMSDNVAYYRQGGNSHMVTAHIMKQLQNERQQK